MAGLLYLARTTVGAVCRFLSRPATRVPRLLPRAESRLLFWNLSALVPHRQDGSMQGAPRWIPARLAP